jgi:hypothetical protein
MRLQVSSQSEPNHSGYLAELIHVLALLQACKDSGHELKREGTLVVREVSMPDFEASTLRRFHTELISAKLDLRVHVYRAYR